MNLNEAMQYQLKYAMCLHWIRHLTEQPQNVARIETTYLRSKAVPGAEDETIVQVSEKGPGSGYGKENDELVNFLFFLLEQEAAVSRAIRDARAKLEIDIGFELGLKLRREEAATALRNMAAISPSEKYIPDGGYGYCFNAAGNQVKYVCDAKKITTINFDRDKVKSLADRLKAENAAISDRIDVLNATTQVDYEPPFGERDGFPEMFFEEYLKMQKKTADDLSPTKEGA